MRVQLLFLALCMIIAVPVKSVPNVQAINTLASKLLHNYRKTTLPSSDFTKPFLIAINVFPVALGDLDDVEEQMASVLGFEMSWNDTSIQWNPEDHNNITRMTLGMDEVWKPTFMLLNPHQQDHQPILELSTTGITYSHLGEANMISRVTLHTSCDLDTTYFPFDTHRCAIHLLLSGHDAYSVKMYPSKSMINFFKESGAWRMDSYMIYFDSKGFDFKLWFKRRPMFILLNILLPLIILALLTPLVFIMPKSSGDRLAYSITMLLSISVYMTIISDHLPKNSEPMPLISILIFVWYVLNALIVLIVILNIKVSHIKDSRRIPGCIRAFVWLTRKLSCKKTLSKLASVEENEKCLKHIDEDENENDCRNKSMRVTWIEVSVAIDRWCFVVMYLIKFGVPAAFIAVLSSNEK